MIELLTAANRGLAVLVAVLPAVIWHWVTSPGQSRGHTFFGARVEPGFAESKTGLAILQEFRRRLWSAALVAAAASGLTPVAAMPAWPMTSSIAGLVAFALAHRRTQREAAAPNQTTVRVAVLATTHEPEGAWLAVLAWLGIVVPLALPIATLTILALYWDHLPGDDRAARLIPVLFGLMLGVLCASNQWALRYRARSSDWAPAPGASHKYRTYFGAMEAGVFTFVIWRSRDGSAIAHGRRPVFQLRTTVGLGGGRSRHRADDRKRSAKRWTPGAHRPPGTLDKPITPPFVC